MASAPLLMLRYASLEDVAQDLDMVIQSSSQGDWSWEGAATQEQVAWMSFVQDPSSASASSISGLAGRVQVITGIALSFSLLSQSQSQDQTRLEAAVDISAPTFAQESVASIKQTLLNRSKEWAQDGIESVFLFDLLTTAQTLIADLPDLFRQPRSENTQRTSNTFSEATQEMAQETTRIDLSRALFWSHHLKAPSKLKDFNNWCPELRLWGIVRVGYPGYLCFEGESLAVDEIVRRVKALQWHAIQLRVQHSWTWSDQTLSENSHISPADHALLSCSLAKDHPNNTHKEKEKVRTGCQVLENLGDLVDRLQGCGLDQEEISEALGIKLSSSQ